MLLCRRLLIAAATVALLGRVSPSLAGFAQAGHQKQHTPDRAVHRHPPGYGVFADGVPGEGIVSEGGSSNKAGVTLTTPSVALSSPSTSSSSSSPSASSGAPYHHSSSRPLPATTVLVASSQATAANRSRHRLSCKLSEFQCGTTDLCVAQDKFCDGEDDCGDKSDEPKYCTPCNRTLYGDVGRTYEVQIRRPREDRLPFLCHLNFTAAGRELGDLIQLTFDTFTVGRFLSFTSDGCPDGFMTIREKGRPATGGQWCGSAWGYTVYYSETRSINLTLYLSRLSGQGNDYNFDFKLSYKFLKRSEAHLRYGNNTLATWRGDLVNATYCDRVFTRCDNRACRLQSPNYPGVYPRNVTCYYRIEQNRAPPGYRALLSVSQRNSHKIHIKDQLNKYDTSQRTLRVWEQCNIVQDYLTVYDGPSTSDRVLVRLCGGDAVPDIVGSRSTMLLEFHTSPYDNPFHPIPLSFLPGFELEVQVLFVDERSTPSFVVKDKENCDFYISSYESSSGTLENPKHSLPPNTTCRYHFQARPNEIVWLAFVKYYAASADHATSLAAASDSSAECNVKLLIWNGDRTAQVATEGIDSSSSGNKGARENATLMGEFCKDDIPRLCDHSLLRNGSRHTRPCSLSESYVSTGRYLTLEHVLRQGSALYPVSFVVRYEFVHEPISCNRIFTSASLSSSSSSAFGSPKSVFFYGRGGATNLTCIYRFEAEPDRRLELSISRASFGSRGCVSRMDPLVNRWSCERTGDKSSAIAELRVAEYPWQGVKLARDCICSNVSERLVLRSLSSSVVELTFTIIRMNVTQDYRDFYFEGEYRFEAGSASRSPACSGSAFSSSPRSSLLEERRLRGTSGEISLRSPLPLDETSLPKGVRPSPQPPLSSLDASSRQDTLAGGVAAVEETIVAFAGAAAASDATGADSTVTRCVNEPWLIEPEDSRLHFLYLKTPGFRLTHHNLKDCPTNNRIVVYSAANTKERTVVCPADSSSAANGGAATGSSGYATATVASSSSHLKIVDLISGGWNVSNNFALQQQHSRSFVVEFLQQQPGFYVVTWMAISKRLLSSSDQFFGGALTPIPVECPYRCPELEACISSVLWCDGVRHCPSGFDEREDNCSYRLGVTLLYVAIGAGALGIFLILLLATGCLKYCLYRRRHRRRRQKMNKKSSPNNKKKVQVLNVNHLDTPSNNSLRNNGSLGSSNRHNNSGFGRYNLSRHDEDDYDDDDHDFMEKYGKDSIC